MIDLLNSFISAAFFVCYFYQFLYILVPLIFKKSVPPADRLHRYAVLICARNEEAVISGLLRSLSSQDYPSDLFRVFVCADNCTDRTAEIAEKYCCEVYERFDNRIGKGFALDFLLKKISRRYSRDYFDGYFIFDADNILAPDYISQMNRLFCAGHRVVTGCRCSKNYGDNWISAGYSLWFLRESQYLNRPRYLLGSSCAVSGTGFLISREILERSGGWKFFTLTEDLEFTADMVISGEKIAYCERALLYDEQPTDFRQSVRQRLRWSKGYLQVFAGYGTRLLRGIFSKNFLSCFDMTTAILPAMVLSLAGVILNISAMIMGIGDAEIISNIICNALCSLGSMYLTFLFIGGLTLLTERDKITCKLGRAIALLPLFPIFMFTYLPISVAAMFINVEWKPIEHKVNIPIKK